MIIFTDSGVMTIFAGATTSKDKTIYRNLSSTSIAISWSKLVWDSGYIRREHAHAF